MILIIEGSLRHQSYTGRAAELIKTNLNSLGIKTTTFIPDAKQATTLEHPLGAANLERLQSLAKDCAGVFFVTPEYHGSYSAVLKLCIENCGYPSYFTGKPIGLIGVAAGVIGAVKSLEHLRSVGAHLGGHVLPSAISIPLVHTVFNEKGDCLDAAIADWFAKSAHEMKSFVS